MLYAAKASLKAVGKDYPVRPCITVERQRHQAVKMHQRGADDRFRKQHELRQPRLVQRNRAALTNDVAVPGLDSSHAARKQGGDELPEWIREVQVHEVEAVPAMQRQREQRQRRRQRQARNRALADGAHSQVAVLAVWIRPRRIVRNEVDRLDLAAGDMPAQHRSHVALDAADYFELAKMKSPDHTRAS